MNTFVRLIAKKTNSANFIGYKSLVIKEVTRFARIWQQTLMAPLITLTLYFMVFGKLIGPRVGDILGFPYIQFITPGLIMLAVVTNSYTNISSSFMISRMNRSIEEILVSPLPNILIILGYTTASAARGLLTGFIVTCVALFFTHLPMHHIIVIVLTAILASTLFSLAGFMVAVVVEKYESVAITQSFVIIPLTYLGGIFYSIESLSPLWRDISLFNPMLYIVDSFRYGILGTSDINIKLSIIVMTLTIVIFLMINLRLLNRRVEGF